MDNLRCRKRIELGGKGRDIKSSHVNLRQERQSEMDSQKQSRYTYTTIFGESCPFTSSAYRSLDMQPLTH